jgi:U3 small nucleolar RNA-associated protein 14
MRAENVNDYELVLTTLCQDLDITLPGWGSWGGIGTNDKPKKRIIKKAAPSAPRKDSGLDHVIINTKKNRKLQAHLVISS